MTKKITGIALTLVLTLTMLFSTSNQALATYQNKPDNENYMPHFPRCPNPGGSLIAGYATGQHQIAGGGLMTGSDYVYKVADHVYVQCFCPENGQNATGIQTSWVHKTALSDKQQQKMTNAGWMTISNGENWGLAAGTYFAQNNPFQCKNTPKEDKPKEHKPEKDKEHKYESDVHFKMMDPIKEKWSKPDMTKKDGDNHGKNRFDSKIRFNNTTTCD